MKKLFFLFLTASIFTRYGNSLEFLVDLEKQTRIDLIFEIIVYIFRLVIFDSFGWFCR